MTNNVTVDQSLDDVATTALLSAQLITITIGVDFEGTSYVRMNSMDLADNPIHSEYIRIPTGLRFSLQGYMYHGAEYALGSVPFGLINFLAQGSIEFRKYIATYVGVGFK